MRHPAAAHTGRVPVRGTFGHLRRALHAVALSGCGLLLAIGLLPTVAPRSAQPEVARRILVHTELTSSSNPVVVPTVYGDVGSGTAGNSPNGVLAQSAHLDDTPFVTSDARGDLFLTDYINQQIRMVPRTSGTYFNVPMLAGHLYTVPVSSGLYLPTDTAVDPEGNLLIVDSYNSRILVVANQSGYYYGLQMTAGSTYVIGGTGVPWPGGIGDSGDGGPAVDAKVDRPSGIALDAEGNVLFVDTGNNLVRLIAESPTNPGYTLGYSGSGCQSNCGWAPSKMFTIAGTGPPSPGNGNPGGGYSGDGGPAIQAQLQYPTEIAIDASGNVLTVDTDNARVRVIAMSAQDPWYQLSGCTGSCSWTPGNIYTIAGNGTPGFKGDGGAATSGELDYPGGIALDARGDILLADIDNQRIRAIAATTGTVFGQSMTAGDIYTIAGNGQPGFSGDGGPALKASFNGAEGLALDAQGELFVADANNNQIRVIRNGVPVGVLGVTPAGAPLGTTEPAGGGNPSEPGCTCHHTSREPVDLSDGDYYDSHTDLSIPGPGIPLAFTRTYDARVAQTSSSAFGVMGPGWSDNLSMNVSYDASTQVATVTQENGSTVTFQWYAKGSPEPTNSAGITWCPADTTAGTYCPTAPRVLGTLSNSGGATGGTWTFTREVSSPVTYGFNSSGLLTGITDAAGNTLSSGTYSPTGTEKVCPTGDACTAWTSSASHQALVVAVKTATGALDEVFEPVSGADTTTIYTYSGRGCSTWAGGAPLDLCRVVQPGRLTTSFTYDSTDANATLRYDLVTNQPPGTGLVTNAYNTSGQVVTQTITNGSSVEKQTFAYTPNSLPGGETTTIETYPDTGGTGTPTTEVDEYSNGVLQERTIGTDQPIVYFDDPTTLLPYAVVDGNGNATTTGLQNFAGTGGTSTSSANVTEVTDGDNYPTQTRYTSSPTDPANLPWCQVDADETADGVVCPSVQLTRPPDPGTGPPTGPCSSASTGPCLGATITYYDPSDRPVAVSDPLGYTSVTAYTTSGLAYCTVSSDEYSVAAKTCPATPPTSPPTGIAEGYTTNIYDAQGELTSTTNPLGATTSYTYSPTFDWLVSTQTDPDGSVTKNTYNAEGWLTKSVVSYRTYSATTVKGYDSSGRPYCTIAPLAYSEGHKACPRPPTVVPAPNTDPYPGASITIYDDEGHVVATVNPLGGVTQYSYDQEGNTICTLGPLAYDQITPTPSCPTAPPNPPTIGSDPFLGDTIYTYDTNNRLLQVTDPVGDITQSTYDNDDNLVSTTVESNNSAVAPTVVTTTAYDGDDQVVSQTVGAGSPLAATTESAYDPNGNLYCTVSADAVASGSFQCPPWQASWISAPPVPTAEYSKSPSATQANDVTLTFDDDDGDQVQSTNPDVETTVSAYVAGQNFCSMDPSNLASWLGAHPSGSYPYACTTPLSSPPTAGSDPGYSAEIFDAGGNVLFSSDPDGNTTGYTYDPAGDVLTVTDADGHTTTNCYYYEHAAGQCAASSPAGGGEASMHYSTRRPDTAADPTGELTTTTYAAGGLPKTATTSAGIATDVYDAAGDLTAIAYTKPAAGYAATPNVSDTYDQNGSIVTMVDGTGTTSYTYDAAGDRVSQAFVAGAGTGLTDETLTYAYAGAGVLSSVTYPSYGSVASPTATYAYDTTGQMASVTDWENNTIAFTHDPDGNETSQANDSTTGNPAGTSNTQFTYDRADELTDAVTTTGLLTDGLTAAGGTTGSPATVASILGPDSTYSPGSGSCTPNGLTVTQSFSGATGSRNPDGQLTGDTVAVADNCSDTATLPHDYGYDLAGRLTYEGLAPEGATAADFGEDPAGNLTTISGTDPSGDFDTYTQVADPAGEILSQTPIHGSGGVATTYTYDTLGDRITATTGGTTEDYGYDQLGRMTTFKNGATTTSYAYGGTGLEVSEDVSGAPAPAQLLWNTAPSIPLLVSNGTFDFVYGPSGTPVEQVDVSSSPPASNPTFLTFTPGDSSYVETNTAGQLTNVYADDAFGSPIAGQVPGSPFGYAGQYTDTSSNSTGFVNMRDRWFDSQTGVFSTVDPMVAATQQPYAYAGDDPVNKVDPTGLDAISFLGGPAVETDLSMIQLIQEIYNPCQRAQLLASYAPFAEVINQENDDASLSFWGLLAATVNGTLSNPITQVAVSVVVCTATSGLACGFITWGFAALNEVDAAKQYGLGSWQFTVDTVVNIIGAKIPMKSMLEEGGENDLVKIYNEDVPTAAPDYSGSVLNLPLHALLKAVGYNTVVGGLVGGTQWLVGKDVSTLSKYI